MDAAFVDENHIAVPISRNSRQSCFGYERFNRCQAGRQTHEMRHSQWHTLGKQARDKLAENSKHDRSLAAVRDAKTAVADKVNEGHQASSVHDNPSH